MSFVVVPLPSTCEGEEIQLYLEFDSGLASFSGNQLGILGNMRHRGYLPIPQHIWAPTLLVWCSPERQSLHILCLSLISVWRSDASFLPCSATSAIVYKYLQIIVCKYLQIIVCKYLRMIGDKMGILIGLTPKPRLYALWFSFTEKETEA